MKELKEELKRLTHVLSNTTEKVLDLNNEIERLSKQSQPTISELYANIDKFIEFVILENSSYEHILGGDGRSRPWSEQRKGKVAEIIIKDLVFLSDEQIEVVKEYVNRIYKPDYITFK